MNYNNKVKIITLQDQIEAGCFDVSGAVEVIENALVKEGEKDVN